MTEPTTEAAIPAGWNPADPDTWSFASTVDAWDGEHASGATYRRFADVVHRAWDLGAAEECEAIRDEAGEVVGYDVQPGTTLAEHAAWWADVLGPIHAWACRSAEAHPDRVAATYAAVGIDPDDPADSPDDLEQDADQCRRLLAAIAGATADA